MQAMKTKADELSALGKPLDHEDLIEKVLEGLDNTYQSVIDAINNRDTPITFDELHEKLIQGTIPAPQLTLPSLTSLCPHRPYSLEPMVLHFSSLWAT
ncbi:hypothetical protein F511_06619 [Dorcoceras hygrometricum]|uniref:Uncharacterized protein n=1 Tax=Dorcoceras hygrometricum TaxID=472368 RepID=A0A2Z7AMT3_9LAMI|nr:hypothetical protein F511_06619 [Dorcoceras hygrometricum]